jgi:hypothetical protein
MKRRKQLLDDLKETTGYYKLKEGTLDRTWCRTGFGRGYENVGIQATKLMNA